MNGAVPPMYWFVFWIALIAVSFTMLWFGGGRDHKARMTALEILKIYAEKGIEPPAAVNDQIMREVNKAPPKKTWGAKKAGSAALWAQFSSSVFMGGVMAGLAWWRTDAGGPQWAIYVTVIGAAVCGIGALGSLMGAIAATVAIPADDAHRNGSE